jgi:AcrR family transcriptional regulator
MASKVSLSIPEKISLAALKLANQKPWSEVTLNDLADAVQMSLPELYDYVQDKTDILVILGRYIDRKTLAALSKPDMEDSVKDRLFEVFMERFDILNTERAAWLSILNALKTDPKAALLSLPHLKHSMVWMMEAAGVSSNGLRGAGQILTLSVLYAEVTWQWLKDDSEDMSKTMAALDKSLTRYENICRTF